MVKETRLNQSLGPDSEVIAIQALSFLAGRPEELGRFLALSGIGPASLRQAAADPAFLGGVLDFLMQEEALLIVFAKENGFAPETVAAARQRLDGSSRQ